jgi:hypothetical protein
MKNFKIVMLLLAIGLNLTIANSQTTTPWYVGGNASTNPPNEFLGTTDQKPLVFKVNAFFSGLLDYDANKGNTTFGYKSLISLSTGIHNSGLGYAALYSNTSGGANTAVGYSALTSNSGAYNNTACGAYSLAYSSGNDNTANGSSSLYNNTGGGQNSATGFRSLYLNTIGNHNTATGYYSLSSNTTGSDNTAIGYLADVLSGALTNATAIGKGAIVNTSNAIQLGNTSVTQIYAGTGNTATVNAGLVNIVSTTGNNYFAGKVVMGAGVTSTPGAYNLYVSGGILTEKIKAALATGTQWSDYVFDEGYQLQPLASVEAYVKKNKHLPGIPSAEELVKDGGIDMNQMFAKQMGKIEELTLYIIEQNKQIESMKARIAQLEKR